MSSTLLEQYDARLDLVLQTAEGRTGEGPSWLREHRRRALAIFREHGVPTPRTEEWKYTPLRSVAETEWQPVEPGPALFDFALPFAVEGSLRAVMVNGQLDRNLSDLPAVPGLTVCSLASALLDHGDKVEKHFGSVASIQAHPFGALNTALFHDGLFVHVARGAAVEQVLEIVHIACGDGQVIAPRILLVLEEGSAIKLTERYVSAGEAASLVIPVTESIVARDANAEHVRVQDESLKSTHIGLWESRVQTGASCIAYNVVYGAALHRLDHNIAMAGEHSTTRLDGVVVADGSQLVDNHTKLDHAVPNCNSFEVYKQIIDDQATIVFNGKIYVHPHAQKTDAKQTNQALLLSPDATINSKPQLEIFADDVKCTHGATVGQLEESPLFYLMSRGMPRAQAQSILVYAFAAEVLELITMEEVKRDLERRLFDKLGVD